MTALLFFSCYSIAFNNVLAGRPSFSTVGCSLESLRRTCGVLPSCFGDKTRNVSSFVASDHICCHCTKFLSCGVLPSPLHTWQSTCFPDPSWLSGFCSETPSFPRGCCLPFYRNQSSFSVSIFLAPCSLLCCGCGLGFTCTFFRYVWFRPSGFHLVQNHFPFPFWTFCFCSLWLGSFPWRDIHQLEVLGPNSWAEAVETGR